MTWIHIGQIRGKHWDRIDYRVDDALGIGSLGQDLAANRISVTWSFEEGGLLQHLYMHLFFLVD